MSKQDVLEVANNSATVDEVEFIGNSYGIVWVGSIGHEFKSLEQAVRLINSI